MYVMFMIVLVYRHRIDNIIYYFVADVVTSVPFHKDNLSASCHVSHPKTHTDSLVQSQILVENTIV
jgi:hypothetical protein